MPLSDTQQAVLMFLAFVLPAFSVWSALGFPMDRAALGLLTTDIISGIIVFIKEIKGGKAPAAPSPT